MSNTTGVMARPKRKTTEPAPTGGGKTETIRVEQDLAQMATIVSIKRGITVGELVSPVLRPFLEEEYRKTVRKMNSELDG